MNINNSQRPIRLTEILVKSLRIYRANFLTIALITLIINVPINLAISVMPSFTLDAIFTLSANADNLKYMLLILVIQLLFAPIGTMAIAYLTREHIENKNVDVVSALNASFFKWIGLVTASLIFAAIIAVSSLAIVLPFYFFNIYGFYIFAVILSGKNGYQALKYSKSLVVGRWFKVFSYWIVLSLFSQGVLIVVSLMFAGFPNNIVTQIICDSVISVLSSYFVCAQVVWFLGLEDTRKSDNHDLNQI